MPRQTAWIVDPLDGSENFVAGVPYFGPAVGLLQGERRGIALPRAPKTVHEPLDSHGFRCSAADIQEANGPQRGSG